MVAVSAQLRFGGFRTQTDLGTFVSQGTSAGA